MPHDFEPFRKYMIRLGRAERTIAGYLIDIHTFAGWLEQTTCIYSLLMT